MALVYGFHSLITFLVVSAALSTYNPVIADVNWRTCGTSLPKACGEVIGRRVTLNAGLPVSDDCCVALVKIGKSCHDAFTRENIKSNHGHKGRTYAVVKRSEEVWNNCVEIAKLQSSSFLPLKLQSPPDHFY